MSTMKVDWVIPWPWVGVKFAQRELGKIKDFGPEPRPVSRKTVVRHILQGDFVAVKSWHGKRYQWQIYSHSLAEYVARETRRRNGENP